MEEIILYGLSAAAIILSLRKTDGQMQSVSRQRFRNRHLGGKKRYIEHPKLSFDLSLW